MCRPWLRRGGSPATVPAAASPPPARQLSANGVRFRTNSDTEVLLAMYEQHGLRFVEWLNGMFAFAIWDPHKPRLFCARDHFGIKPFFYYQGHSIGTSVTDRAHTFLFASEIKAILGCIEAPCPINETRIAEFLVSDDCDRAHTIYQGILRLQPGHWLSVTSEGMRSAPYWKLQPQPEQNLSSDQEYADAFLMHFTEAVRCRLRSTTAIGSHLSGGLDSSAVTCMARQLLKVESGPGRLHTFSNVFDQVPECDER
ncbi:MAG: asparagine synthetase B, partial [Limnobacter sp.]|nr:asparagine synthetase B [Limnobacter sp.]